MALHEFNYEKDKVADIVKKILEDAILIYATDIHLDPTEKELIIKLRIDGDLIEYTSAPDSFTKNIITRIKILSGMNITETSIPQTGIISYKVKGKSYTMRVSSIPVLYGEKIVVHISNHSTSLASLDDLNFSDDDLKQIRNLINNNSGTILVAGSNVSGKSTTLYALIKELDHNKNNIFSIENRIKIKMDGINQIQVDESKGLTPINILDNVILSDPNVISLYEVNDVETANLLFKEGSNGKLVLSTVRAKNIYNTIDNLINMDVESYLLSSLTGVIAQRLVKTLCPKCKRVRKTTEKEKELFTKVLNKNVKEIHEPVGCDNCINGYQGQMPISEVLEINDTIRNSITSKKERNKLRSLIYQDTTSIFQDGLNKVLNGDTSLEEVIKALDLNIDFDKDNADVKKLILDEFSNEDIEVEPSKDTSIKSLISDKMHVMDIEIQDAKDIKKKKEKIVSEDDEEEKEDNSKNKIFKNEDFSDEEINNVINKKDEDIEEEQEEISADDIEIEVNESDIENNEETVTEDVQEDVTKEANTEEVQEDVTEEPNTEEVQEDVTEDANAEEVQEDVTEETNTEEVQEDVTEEANAEEVQEDVTEETNTEEVQEDITEEANAEEVQEDVTEEANTEEVQEDVTEDANAEEVQEDVNEVVNYEPDNVDRTMANETISMDEEQINKIKATIDYDDFSYDDSYKNNF